MTCYRLKSTVWRGKFILPKKIPKYGLFMRQRIWVSWLWEEMYAKLLVPGQLLGYPWKLWGTTVQISYVEGRWHQNWARNRPPKFFWGRQQKLAKNGNLLLFGPLLGNKERYWVGPQKVKRPVYIGDKNAFWAKISFGAVLILFWSPEVGWGRPNEIR